MAVSARVVGCLVLVVTFGCGRIGYDLFGTERFPSGDGSMIDAAGVDGGSVDGSADASDGAASFDGSTSDASLDGSTAPDGAQDAGMDATGGSDAGNPGLCPFVPCMSDRGITANASGSSGFGANTRDAPASSGTCGGMGPQVSIVRFTASADLMVTATVSSTDFDPLVYVRAGDCCGPELACDDNGGGGTTAEVTVSMLDGETVYMIVDGVGPADQGAFDILFNRSPP